MESKLCLAVAERGWASRTSAQSQENGLCAPERFFALSAPLWPESGLSARFKSRSKSSAHTGDALPNILGMAGNFNRLNEAVTVIVTVGFLRTDPCKRGGVAGLVGGDPCGSCPAAECGTFIQLDECEAHQP